MAIATPPTAPPTLEAPQSPTPTTPPTLEAPPSPTPTTLPPPASAPHPQWWQRLTVIQAMALGIALGVGATILAVLIIPLLYNKPAPSQAATSASQSSVASASAAAATPTAAPTAQGVAMGTVVPTKQGDSYQVIAFRRVTSNNQFNTPPAGGYFAAANVKVCASAAGPSTALPTAWRLVMSDDSQVQADYSTSLLNIPGSALERTDLQPSACVSGWVSFPVPGGDATPARLQLGNADFYWQLP